MGGCGKSKLRIILKWNLTGTNFKFKKKQKIKFKKKLNLKKGICLIKFSKSSTKYKMLEDRDLT